ncbi:ABC transporter substrate-binding protein, partial [Parageobacillus sp. SY1]
MKKWKQYVMLLVFILTFGFLFGCNGENASKEPAKKEEPKTEQAAFPVTVKDGLGEDVTI